MNKAMSAYTNGLSQLLQGTSQDVLLAYEEIRCVKDIFNQMQQDPQKQYKKIHKEAGDMVEKAGMTLSLPR